MSVDVIVIGAGISGLSVANELAGQGIKVSVLERQANTGGNAVSRRFDGFLMEQGPSTLNAAMPGAMDHLSALDLGQSAEALGPNVRKRYLRDARGLMGISAHPLGFFLSNYLSPLERLSMAVEILRPRRSAGPEETIHQFAARRFGRGFADKVMEPLVAGIFMGDSAALSVNGAFPKLYEMEQRCGSVTRAVLAAKRGAEPGRNMVSWAGGIGTLPRTLAARLGKRVSTGVAVTGVRRDADGFTVTTARDGALRARAVVLAVQPHVGAALLDGLDPEGTGALAAIAAPPVGVVFLGYRRSQVAHPLDGLGFLGTKAGGQIVSGAQFCSTMFGGRAPQDHVAISCYVGGARNPEAANLPAPELIDAVHREIAGLMGITDAPVVARTHCWPRGLPQYTLGHAARSDILRTTNARVPGLFVTGNFIEGVSVTSCLSSAVATAANVREGLIGDEMSKRVAVTGALATPGDLDGKRQGRVHLPV